MPWNKEPLTEDEVHRIHVLHARGMGRNDIARDLKRSGETISRYAVREGLSFSRGGEVEAATKARSADVAVRRIALAEALLTDAENLRKQLWSETTVFNFGGKDNTYAERTVDEPPAGDKRMIMTAIGVAIDRSLKLAPPQDDSGAEQARSMVGQLMAGLGELYREQQQEPAGEGAGDAP